MSNNKPNIFNKYSADVYAKTKKYQKEYNFEIGKGEHDAHNNEADAFKHTFASVETSLLSTHLSKALGDFHEWQGKNNNQPWKEENMDRWNNAVGRDIAREIKREYTFNQIINHYKSGKLNDIIAKKVVDRMKKGDLITNLNDPRIYKEPKSPSERINEGIREQYRRLKSRNDWRLERIFGSKKSKSVSDSDIGQGHWVTINGRHVFIG